MPKLMKPVTFGCDNGFQEVYYESLDPTDSSKHEPGKVYCYLGRLEETEKSERTIIKKCMATPSGQCWKTS